MKSAESIVWVCSCGCKSFFLHEGGDIECANCNVYTAHAENGRWANVLPELPDEVTTDDGGAINVKCVGSAEFARRRAMKRITEWSTADKLAAVFGYHHDGSGSHWTDIANEEQKQWVLRKLRELLTHLEATAP